MKCKVILFAVLAAFLASCCYDPYDTIGSFPRIPPKRIVPHVKDTTITLQHGQM